MKNRFDGIARKWYFCAAGILALLILFVAGGVWMYADENTPTQIFSVDKELAWNFAVAQVAMGPRPADSENAEKCAAWIAEQCRKAPAAPRVFIQEFTDRSPRGYVKFRNVVAEIPGKNKERIVLIGAHYDTKRLASTPDFVGANDGASGVAALLAMIHAMPEDGSPFPFTLRFVFFDGEEAMDDYGPYDGLHGSRYHAKQLVDSGQDKLCRAMILLDMIGDRKLNVRFPADTDKTLLQKAEKAALNAGAPAAAFQIGPGYLIDDHVPFQKIGIPVINFIDFDYGPGNACWHTEYDTLDRISADSIALTADTVFQLLSVIDPE